MKNYKEKNKCIELQVWILVILQIDAVVKVFILDLWNLDTKNVKHSTSRDRCFQITEMMHITVKAYYFLPVEINHPVSLEMGKEIKGGKREKKKIGGKYNLWQYQITNTDY